MNESRDDIAMEGMLRELAAGEGGEPDMEYVDRVMKAVRDDSGKIKTIELPTSSPARFLMPAAALFLFAGVAIYHWLQPRPIATVTGYSLRIERNGNVRQLSCEDRLYAGDVVVPREIAAINLSDGSELTLDAKSRLTLVSPETDERMRLKLESGRLFVRVTKGKGRFIVEAGGPVEVLGTTFGVNRAVDGADVAVYEGCVAVGSAGNRVEITRGQAARIDSRGYGQVANLDVERVLGWARKAVAFNKQPLGEFIDWVEANSAYRFEVSADLRRNINVIAGIDATTDIRKVLLYIAESNQLKYRINGHDVLISR